MTIEELKVLITAETSELRSALKQVNSSVRSLGGNITKTTNKITNTVKSSIKSLTSSFKTLGSVVTKALSFAALSVLGVQAINLASDIEEVQNVVNVAFGEMAAQAEFFAQRCASAFGLSELMAKRTSSTYMAMAKSMGLTNQAAKTMSLQLTALTGDMSSFYNVSQDVADTALKSVFTGETETLKKFGIVMTEANLNAYGLAKGIKKSYSEMSQAEKVALRYNYVMENTALAQGDFIRTSSSWANQIRLLKMRWEELLAAMGTILTHVLIPIIQALNTILSQIVSIAKGFAAMFNAKKPTDEITSMSGGFSGVSDSIDDATASAKEYKRTVSGFDELNILKDPNAGAGDAGAAGSGFNMEIAEPYDFNSLAGATDEAKISLQQIIDDFNGFIANLNTKMQEYRGTVEGWATNLASGINTIVDGISWDNIGQSIGNGLNLIIGFFKNFREELQYYNIGEAIAELLNNITYSVDWTALTDSLVAKFNGAIQGITGFVQNFDVSALIAQLTLMFRRIAQEVDWVGLGKAIGEFFNMAITSAYELITGVDFKLFATNVIEGIKSALHTVDWQQLGATIKELIIQTLDSLQNSGFVEELGNSIKEFLSGLDFGEIFKELKDTLGDVLADIFSGLTGIEDGAIVNGIADIAAGLMLLWPIISKVASVMALLNLSKMGNLLLWIIGLITGIPAKLANVIFNTKNLSEAAKEAGGIIEKVKISFKGLTGVMENGGTVFKSWKSIATNALNGVKTKISGFVTNAGTLFTTFKTKTVGIFTSAKTSLISIAGGIKSGALTAFTGLKSGALTAFTGLKTGVAAAFTAIKGAISAAISFIIANPIALIIAAIVALVVLIATKGDEIQALLNKVTNFLTGIFTKDWTEVFGPVLGGILNGFAASFKGIWDGIHGILNGVIDMIRGVFTGDWKRAWEGVKQIFKGVWDTLSGIAKAPLNMIIGFLNAIIGGVESTVNFLIRTVNKLQWTVPDWVPAIGGESFGFNFKEVSWGRVPQLADGGAVYESTLANIGEYAGARHNPEIVAPQSLMKETMEQAMLPMINAYVAMGNRLLKAIEDKDLDVYMDTTKVTRKITKEQHNQAKYASTSLVLV